MLVYIRGGMLKIFFYMHRISPLLKLTTVANGVLFHAECFSFSCLHVKFVGFNPVLDREEGWHALLRSGGSTGQYEDDR